jgi:4-amino-4-deoxy-L-arabinose transferase-like glycosyltransferase
MRQRNLKFAGLVVIAALAFLPGVGRRAIVTSHEARVAQTARQMAAAGWPWSACPVPVAPAALMKTPDGVTKLTPQWDREPILVNPWFVPVLNREIRLQKPPLPYWCAAILYRLAGVEWSEGLARLVPAVLGAGATLLIYGLGRRLYGRVVGWCAALAWTSTYFIAEQYRLAMADPYLAFFTLLCVWAWIAASEGRGMLFLFYVSLGLGLLAKGPPLFVQVGVPIVLYHVFYRRRTPGSLVAHLLGIAIVAAMVAPWIAYVGRHVPNVVQMWKYESVGELPGGENVEKARPLWFYLPNLFVMSAPWTVLWLAGACLRLARKEHGRKWFALAWYLVVVAFFSLLPVKKPTYLVPAMPAQALLVGRGLAVIMAAARKRGGRGDLLAWVQAVVGLGAGIGVVVLIASKVQGSRGVALAVSVLTLAAATGAVAELRGGRAGLWLWRQTVAYVLAIVAVLAFYRVDDDARRSAKPVCDEVRNLMQQTGASLALTKLPEEASLYLPLDLALPQPTGQVLVIVDDPRNTKETPALRDRAPYGNVTSVERVPLKSAPGDARWKVFRLNVEEMTKPETRNPNQ